jgi:hypothetical protein
MEHPHNHRRRIAMNKHQRSIKPGLLAAAIAATVLVSAANVQAASGIAQDQQDQRTPIVSLTSAIGDVGAEIFDGRTQRYNFATLPKHVDNAIVYIDVDSLQWGPKRTRAALELAKDLNWVVMVESATWNVPRLHAFLAAHFPGTSTEGLQNVAVRIGWDNGRAVATDLTPSEAAVEVGIDYLQTTEGAALAARLWRDNLKTFAKTVAPGSQFAWFANAAYEANPTDRTHTDGRLFKLTFRNDVLKIWTHKPDPRITVCIVGWRGTKITSLGDIGRDLQLQFGTAKAIQGDNSGAKFGHGYMERFKNQVANVHAVGCTNYRITGHSLGGGMAQLHAYRLRNLAPIIEAYNPARAGNDVFQSIMRPSVDNGRTRIFCRTGDPVAFMPTGLVSAGTNNGCTYWGARFSVRPVPNHDMHLWL